MKATERSKARTTDPHPTHACGMMPRFVYGSTEECGLPATLGYESVAETGLVPICDQCIAWVGVQRRLLKKLAP